MLNEVPRYNSEMPEFPMPPERITAERPFIAIGDLHVMAEKFIPHAVKDPGIRQLQQRLLNIQRRYAPERSTFYCISHEDLISGIEMRVRKQIAENIDAGVLSMDRYLFAGISSPRLFRLELSRGADNQLVPRPGAKEDRETQINTLRVWLQHGQFNRVVLADDVIALANTFPPIIEMVREALPDAELAAVAGICSSQGDNPESIWKGRERLAELGVAVDAVVTAVPSAPEENGSSGMAIPDSRDSTIFGGKIGKSVDGRTVSYPYFYPFSVPTLSLMRRDMRERASYEWQQFNIGLVGYLNERMGREMMIGDLEARGYGVPYTSIPELQSQLEIPSAETPVLAYLKHVQDATPVLMQSIEQK